MTHSHSKWSLITARRRKSLQYKSNSGKITYWIEPSHVCWVRWRKYINTFERKYTNTFLVLSKFLVMPNLIHLKDKFRFKYNLYIPWFDI